MSSTTERERRELAQTVAIQLLYFLGQRKEGRFLNQQEMFEAMRTADEFLKWFFGDPE